MRAVGRTLMDDERGIPKSKALQNWKISVKALSKRLWKLTIITK